MISVCTIKRECLLVCTYVCLDETVQDQINIDSFGGQHFYLDQKHAPGGVRRCLIHEFQNLTYVGQPDLRIKTLNIDNTLSVINEIPLKKYILKIYPKMSPLSYLLTVLFFPKNSSPNTHIHKTHNYAPKIMKHLKDILKRIQYILNMLIIYMWYK